MMENPIPVKRDDGLSADDRIKIADAKNKRLQQNGFLIILGVIVLSFFVPLGVWLTRLAMGY